jgi:hypothetical protein
MLSLRLISRDYKNPHNQFDSLGRLLSAAGLRARNAHSREPAAITAGRAVAGSTTPASDYD